MARVTPDEFASKWASRLSGATEDVRRGVQRVTEAPTQKAAAKKDKMKTKLVQAIDSGKWERALRAVDLGSWQAAFMEKGINRIASGAQASQRKMSEFASKLLPHIDAAVSKIQSMPDVTLEDNINRMTAFIREMAKFKKA